MATLRREGVRRLRLAGVDSPELDVALLLAFVLEVPRYQLAVEPDRAVPPAAAARFDALLRRREAREPLAYLVGRRDFHQLTLEVGPGALVPRPDTELLVELALERIPGDGRGLRVLDVGTGSGCVAAAIRRARPAARVVASELSAAALAVARGNLAPLGVPLVRGDLVDWVAPAALDLLVSNPPYLDPAGRAALAPELAHEPEVALFAPEAGLALLRSLVAAAPGRLRPGGWLLLEHGHDQGEATRAAAAAAGLEAAETRRDLAGRDRCLVARKAHA